jgi:RNA polymerase sigma factor (sigma-70 family)
MGKNIRLTEAERKSIGNPTRLVWHFVWWCVGKKAISRSEADELASNCFLKITRFFSRYDPSKSSYSSFINLLCRNAFIDYLRIKKESPVSLDWDIEEKHSGIDVDFLRECIQKAKMTKRQRQVMLLSIENNFAETGRILGCRRWSVFFVYHRGLESLKKYMRIHGYEMRDFAA